MANEQASEFTEQDLVMVLKTYGGDYSKKVAQEPKLVKSLFDLAKGVAKSNPMEMASSTASISSTILKNIEVSENAKGLAKSSSTALSIGKASMGLVKITSMTSFSAIIVLVGATTVQKTGIALSLFGDQNDRAKCSGALMEFTGSAIATAVLGVPTGGWVIALTALSLTAQAYVTYDACFQ